MPAQAEHLGRLIAHLHLPASAPGSRDRASAMHRAVSPYEVQATPGTERSSTRSASGKVFCATISYWLIRFLTENCDDALPTL